jgi:hypothetical protein
MIAPDLIFKFGNQFNVSMVNEKVTGPVIAQNPRGECASGEGLH